MSKLSLLWTARDSHVGAGRDYWRRIDLDCAAGIQRDAHVGYGSWHFMNKQYDEE